MAAVISPYVDRQIRRTSLLTSSCDIKKIEGQVMLKRKRDCCFSQPEHGQSKGVVVVQKYAAAMDDEKTVEIPSRTLKVRSRAIFVLENASLKKGIVQNRPTILDSAEHADFLLSQGKKLEDYCPYIVYEALRNIVHSPLNQLGMVGAVYVRTDSGVLFGVTPHIRIPRTCNSFCGVILQLLEKSFICAKGTGDVLLRVLNEPLSQYLPENARVVGLSYNCGKRVDLDNYVSAVNEDVSLVFVVGAMLHGEVSKDNTDDYISVSNYPLTTGSCIARIVLSLGSGWKLF